MDFLWLVKSMEKILKELDSIMDVWVREHELRRLNGEVETKKDFKDVLLSAVHDDSQFGNSSETVIKATILGADANKTSILCAAALPSRHWQARDANYISVLCTFPPESPVSSPVPSQVPLGEDKWDAIFIRV
ncbi:hypothetical protein GH714_026394 [Hevea brasiliensis]|uniref:Uncharacterized protein n=1 Tax=Hevea brasiliensis TaxID=3981 RepID=A0A6A6KAR4_HEVBR|nr:hypothetical protein GH714_026394 [Hevea brasiliensis]